MWFILLAAGQHPPPAPKGNDILFAITTWGNPQGGPPAISYDITTIGGNPQGGPVAAQQLLEGIFLDPH